MQTARIAADERENRGKAGHARASPNAPGHRADAEKGDRWNHIQTSQCRQPPGSSNIADAIGATGAHTKLGEVNDEAQPPQRRPNRPCDDHKPLQG